MYFSDFIRDRFAVIERIYEAFDLPMSDDAARAMRAFIADNPPGKHDIHEYAPEAFEIVPEQVRDAFCEYISHFGLDPEARAAV